MKRSLLFLIAFLPVILACEKQKSIDLAKLNLNEAIESVINFKDTLVIGVETVEYPFCLLLEADHADTYTFDGIPLGGRRVIFQIEAEKLKTDSITRLGGGHIDLHPVKTLTDLQNSLKEQNAANKIYGFRIEMKTGSLQLQILKKLQTKYGKGLKNPNTAHGLYWNIRKEHKLIFYAPEYDRLIVLNSTNLSKTCYWDFANGLINLGGCDSEKYNKELTKNSTPPAQVKDKPSITIDKNWNISGLTLGQSTEADFKNAPIGKGFQRTESMDANLNLLELLYEDPNHDFYCYFAPKGKNAENKKENLFKGYTIQDFEKVQISFENGLKPGIPYQDVIKLFDKNLILNYADLDISNYIEIKNGPYKVTLSFNDQNVFSGMYVK